MKGQDFCLGVFVFVDEDRILLLYLEAAGLSGLGGKRSCLMARVPWSVPPPHCDMEPP